MKINQNEIYLCNYFNEYLLDGNTIFINGFYSTQDTNYKNRLKNKTELFEYFKKEIMEVK